MDCMPLMSFELSVYFVLHFALMDPKISYNLIRFIHLRFVINTENGLSSKGVGIFIQNENRFLFLFKKIIYILSYNLKEKYRK